jgi:hypothetical protein
MAKNNVKKKPTAKEIASAVIEINHKVNELSQGLDRVFNITKQLDSVFGLYLGMKGEKDTFSAYLDEKEKEYKAQMEKENDKKANGESNTEDIPENTENEGSGAEGVRKETK